MRAAEKTKARPDNARSGGGRKGEFYRQCRLWHGYLSAFAFLALGFFAATGLLLNHPTWLASQPADPVATEVVLSAQTIARAKASADPAKALAKAVGEKAKLRGAYQSGELDDDQALIRLEGVTGASDITVDLATGATEVDITKADAVSTLNQLHRGKNAGAVWKALIDVSAIVILALSIVGYVLFFSLRFRLRTSLTLTAASLLAMVGLFLVFVP